MSGDARRALEICRRAAEFADYRIKQSGRTSANKVLCTYVWDLVTKSVYIGFLSLYAYINLDHQYKSTLCYSFMTQFQICI